MTDALYDFGHSQEDERTEATALGLPGGSVLSVTSAGEMPLSLLALGAERVLGVDISPAQGRLARLKHAAALALDRPSAVRFLGYLPTSVAARRDGLERILPSLGADDRAFWRGHPEILQAGPIWCGRFERFLRVVLKVTAPVLSGPFRELCACQSLGEQRACFGRRLDRPVVRALFRAAFHPRIYGGAGLRALALAHHDRAESLGELFFERFRGMCEQTPAADNPFLQLFTLGEVRHDGVVPTYLTEAGVARLRERPDAPSFVCADVVAHLESAPQGEYDRFHLSNVTDWLPVERFERLLRAIRDRARRPAKVVWRHIHPAPALDPRLLAAFSVRRDQGDALQALDRYPIYRVVPAELP